MHDSENVLRTICCTCLSRKRKLFQLCRLADGVNNLYSLLSYDEEAYKEVFYKDTASLHVCWECKAVLSKISLFRHQACSIQKQLTDIADGRTNIENLKHGLSNLITTTKDTYDVIISNLTDETDNFIDCGPASSDDDIPLSELNPNCVSDDDSFNEKIKSRAKVKLKKKTNVKINDNESSLLRHKKYFTETKMSNEDMLKMREEIKLGTFKDALCKCESCLIEFKTDIALKKHDEDFHTMKEKHSQCSTCLSFTPDDEIESHLESHLMKYTCKLCGLVVTPRDMAKHVYGHREMKDLRMAVSPNTKMKNACKDKISSHGDTFKCPECNKYFDTKNKRWKHIQRCHREGYACDKCGKRFPFANNLNRHVRLHLSPPPREQCPICRKSVRCDLMKSHALTHAARERHSCRACDKSFVSRASYQHHLKYTRAHAHGDILKYKCETCDKGYRSRAELRDHVSYQHENRTRHKCPECGKALATRRCIARHVRRAHRGVKENARDKICQLCGKAFRDKKGLREHQFIHSGERPLSCEICGRTFRQSASLYTHRKRVHKICPRKKNVELLDIDVK